MGRNCHPGFAAPALLAVLFCLAGRTQAAPPFLTDDPEPVEYRHWEFYAASQWSIDRSSITGTCPHFEVNYGAVPNLQLHIITPAAFFRAPGGPTEVGMGDIELGAKLRFITETNRHPQAGIFPLVTLPSGSRRRGLGLGVAEATLPVWIQKSFGAGTRAQACFGLLLTR
jgi:hypothetical protein